MAGFIGNKPADQPLTTLPDGIVTNDDLAGSITDSKISTLSASKLTGSIADARVPASAVTQHVTATDLAPVRSDILKLALHQAIDGNRVAYSLEDSFIDGFEDDTGITTETTVDRDASGEYVSTTVSSAVNATGTLISDPQTASTSRTSASGVIIYEDAEGTNTLGSDLKVYFSCDNSTWTEAASYGTATTYSGTKKLVKLGATTCSVSGTAIAMKAVWANQVAPVAGTQSLIAQNTGTALGNMTLYGGLAGLFDGVTTQNYLGGGAANGGTAYVGKDWGSGNTKGVSGVKVFGTTTTGYNGQGGVTNFYLYGSNSSPTSATNGTLIKTLELNVVGQGANTNPRTYLTGIDDSTEYRYHWMTMIGPTEISAMYLAEVEFYDTTVGVTGKEARLHGWAVNY